VADKHKKLTEATSKQEKEISKVKKLEAENKKLKQEINLLKKWQRFLAEEHQQEIDSSRNSDKNQASSAHVSGWVYPAAVITPGATGQHLNGSAQMLS